MSVPLNLGIELPGEDLLSALGPQLRDLARSLDASGAAYAIIGGERDGDAPHASASSTVVGALIARHTRRIGIVAAASPQRDHPFNIARRTASLDHFSAGRAGLLALRRDQVTALGLGATSVWTDAPADAATLAAAIVAVRKLWRTWPLESLDPELSATNEALVRVAAHQGVFPTRGPLNSPTTPQGEPVVFWRWHANAPPASELAALDCADVVQVEIAELDAFLRIAADTLHRAHEAGEPIQVHVRTPWHAALDAQLNQWRGTWHVAGVTLLPKVGELSTWLAQGRLAGLSGILSGTTFANGITLRARLGIARRIEPDLGGNAPAFEAVKKVTA